MKAITGPQPSVIQPGRGGSKHTAANDTATWGMSTTVFTGANSWGPWAQIFPAGTYSVPMLAMVNNNGASDINCRFGIGASGSEVEIGGQVFGVGAFAWGVPVLVPAGARLAGSSGPAANLSVYVRPATAEEQFLYSRRFYVGWYNNWQLGTNPTYGAWAPLTNANGLPEPVIIKAGHTNTVGQSWQIGTGAAGSEVVLATYVPDSMLSRGTAAMFVDALLNPRPEDDRDLIIPANTRIAIRGYASGATGSSTPLFLFAGLRSNTDLR